ncbi:MAG: SoxR reducing system RseC family protein [Clostridia bacterium]|nr:SoxR reducing system RseC family protein [Clostridia bacterium]
MNKQGIVESIKGNEVTVRITRDSSCGENCAMCNACPGKNMLVTLNTDIPLSVNDKVSLQTNSKLVLWWAFAVYILPIILLILGYAIFTLYIGVLFMIISFIILFFTDKKINKNHMINISKVH